MPTLHCQPKLQLSLAPLPARTSSWHLLISPEMLPPIRAICFMHMRSKMSCRCKQVQRPHTLQSLCIHVLHSPCTCSPYHALIVMRACFKVLCAGVSGAVARLWSLCALSPKLQLWSLCALSPKLQIWGLGALSPKLQLRSLCALSPKLQLWSLGATLEPVGPRYKL